MMAPEGFGKLRDLLLFLLLSLTLLAELLEMATASSQELDRVGDIECPSVCRCDEDFIYCNDRRLSTIPPLPPSATVLYLQNNHINNAGLPKSLEHHTTVHVIYLYDNELGDFPMHLPPSLRELHLQDNNIRVLERAALARLPLIEKLHLDDNSVSTVSIEDQAFADNPRLRLLFLSRNHLSSIPSGLPASIEELRLDDNRISTIPTHAFRGLSSLHRLVLDGNLLANQRIADDTFSRLSNLTELSLVRNSLQTTPLNLPRVHLQRLSLQDNAIIHMPRGSLDGMHRLQHLDLSGNNLTTLPRGLFRDLKSLGQLLVQGNPWHCGCNLHWLHNWLKAKGNTITVRGFVCHTPERVRDMALKDLTNLMDECEMATAGGGGGAGVGGNKVSGGGVGAISPTLSSPQGSLFTLRSKRPGLGFPETSLDYTLSSSGVSKNLALKVKPISLDSIRVTWSVAQASSSFRLSWLCLGTSSTKGSITETLVKGDQREYLLTSLQPASSYIICMVPLVSNSGSRSNLHGGHTDLNEVPVCARTETSNPIHSDDDQGAVQSSDQMSSLPLAGTIGGTTAIVSLVLIIAIFCCYGRHASCTSRDHYSHSSSRKSKHYDDYIKSGTKKDNTILEISSHGFQMTPMTAKQTEPKPVQQDVIHTIFSSNGTGLYQPTNNMTNSGYGTKRGYRGGIPDRDYSYT